MVDCAVYRPHHQNQLNFDIGGKHGGVNCTACAAAMVAEAVLCGPKHVFKGKQIRAASNEPTPDKDLPGLTLRQVANALDTLTDGQVELTIRQPIAWPRLKRRLMRGQVAVLQVRRRVFIDQGFGFNKGFRGNHAVTIGFDRGTLWVDDPLARKFLPTWEQLADAAAALRLEGGSRVGDGFAWAAFAPRGAAKLEGTHRIEIRPGKILRYQLRGGLIFDRTVISVPEPIVAVCTEPTRFRNHPGGSRAGKPAQELVVVLDGPGSVAGFGFRDTAGTVTITERDEAAPVLLPKETTVIRSEVTSPERRGAGVIAAVTDEDLTRLTHEATRGRRSKDEDVGEPTLAPEAAEPDEDPAMLVAV
jgi:hypothetical protein